MTKAELMNLVDKHVTVEFKDGEIGTGILTIIDEFSSKHGYRICTGDFYLKNSTCNVSFKVSHIKKAWESL